uniref:Uncharacterized protein n=1 Tax=Arundo donax TaxID=35708 RepID=A0A0A8ZX63_ARUDO
MMSPQAEKRLFTAGDAISHSCRIRLNSYYSLFSTIQRQVYFKICAITNYVQAQM